MVLDGLSDSTFQSTLPVWGATDGHQRRACGHRNFNPRSPCGERPIAAAKGNQQCDFNPRSPCGERPYNRRITKLGGLFQSTLPVWGATAPRSGPRQRCGYFNPRSPCGERLGPDIFHSAHFDFNPRSPCGERQDGTPKLPKRRAFQSTLPVWGATASGSASPGAADISIHAPRVGSDRSSWAPDRRALRFQSTLPVWGATWP